MKNKKKTNYTICEVSPDKAQVSFTINLTFKLDYNEMVAGIVNPGDWTYRALATKDNNLMAFFLNIVDEELYNSDGFFRNVSSLGFEEKNISNEAKQSFKIFKDKVIADKAQEELTRKQSEVETLKKRLKELGE